MVDSRDTSPHIEQPSVINQSWVSALIKEDVFEGDPSTWRVTESNYRQVLIALNLNV